MGGCAIKTRKVRHRLQQHDAKRRQVRSQYSGITRPLHRVYYPKYSFKRALRRKVKSESDDKKATFKTRSRADRSNAGRKRGSIVDNEVAKAIKHYRRACLDDRRLSAEEQPPSLYKFAVRHSLLENGLSRQILKHVDIMGWTAIDSHVHVEDVDSQTRTAADFVCVQKANPRSFAVMELKCGFEGYVSLHSGNMLHELKRVPNSPRNQHHLQVALTREMYARTYDDSERVRAFVIWANDSAVHHEEVAEWALTNAPAALKRLGKRLARKENARAQR
ncbi:hypothetical protein CYMTET_2720 [Cymbomonas tetramitiformis]|uniref:Uncharacterized protein n=1 Tax=Cymbomonas tetramitiformis TaxID=36881 RepID=A0AAE0LLI7_9CHLO|nr:hypothetical protein CYMTET_44605 [Cymbomonas tetramitiformis]KAK3289861.1 hypothetical protein CYMTET_2720 [Cymbomonas tetramitiformis]